MSDTVLHKQKQTNFAFTKITEKAHYDNMKSLPIRMKDRRRLYEDLQEIYDFERLVHDKPPRPKAIFCFRIRLFFLTFWDALQTYEMWQSSLREIEIERGTLIANVFYFIKSTMVFNFSLVIIVMVGIMIPHFIVWKGFAPGISDQNRKLCSDYDELNPNQSANLNALKVATCCNINHRNATETEYEQINPNLRFLIKLSDFLGGSSSWSSTVFFYGYYTSFLTSKGPLLAFLYLASVVTVLLYSYWELVRSVANGVAEIVRNKDGDVCVFSELIFCGYHHRTLTEEEARFRRKLWLHNLRVAIKAAKTWARKAKDTTLLLLIRIVVFVATVILILVSAACVFFIAKISLDALQREKDKDKTGATLTLVDVIRRIGYSVAPALAVTVSNMVLPNVFIKLANVEKYGTETTTFVILYRALAVRLLSVILALYRVFQTDLNCVSVIPDTCIICDDDPLVKRGTHCWESVLASELYKIIFTELFIKTFLTFVVDPFRKMLKVVFYRIKLFRKIGTLKFNVIRHSLDIINIQVMAWMGFYFAPGYPFAVCLYLFVIFYVKKFAVLRNCSGVPEAYKVTRTTLIFTSGKVAGFIIVLIFLLVILGLLQPSRGCGPFGVFSVTYDAVGYLGISVAHHTFRPLFQAAHIIVASWHTLIIVICITVVLFLFYVKNYNQYQADNVKDLIFLENEDKQYLATKLLLLRSFELGKGYYNPYSVFDSEKRLIESSNKRPNLDSQWRAMRQAILPPGANSKKKKSIDLKKVASILKKSKSGSEGRLAADSEGDLSLKEKPSKVGWFGRKTKADSTDDKSGKDDARKKSSPGDSAGKGGAGAEMGKDGKPGGESAAQRARREAEQRPPETYAQRMAREREEKRKGNQVGVIPGKGRNAAGKPVGQKTMADLSEDSASTVSKPRAGKPHRIFQDKTNDPKYHASYDAHRRDHAKQDVSLKERIRRSLTKDREVKALAENYNKR